MFGQNRAQMRQFFSSSWNKRLAGENMEPLESLVAGIIEQHPEYQDAVLSKNPEQDFSAEQGETNPFLHMGMHITLAEQLSTDRPPGIRTLHQKICAKKGNVHQAEHDMMECLGLVLWEAQRQNRQPDDQAYLDCLKRFI